MPKKHGMDEELLSSIAGSFCDAISVFPKRMIRLDQIQREQHMPLSHIQILTVLNAEGPMSIGKLSRRLAIAKPNITPLIDTMREEGLVSRQRDEEDRRIVNVAMQPAGEARLAAIRESIGLQVDTWAAKLSRSELKDLNNALAVLVRISAVAELDEE